MTNAIAISLAIMYVAGRRERDDDDDDGRTNRGTGGKGGEAGAATLYGISFPFNGRIDIRLYGCELPSWLDGSRTKATHSEMKEREKEY